MKWPGVAEGIADIFLTLLPLSGVSYLIDLADGVRGT